MSPATANRAFIAILALGIATRLVLLAGPWQGFDWDEAVGMLMAARSPLHRPPMLFWGADYGGTVVTWVEMVLTRALGFHVWVFRVVDVAVAAVAAWLFWLVAKRILEPVGATLATALFWLGPPAAVFFTSHEYVFWNPATCAALACCYAALRWREVRSAGWLALSGLFAGLTLWCYPLYLCIVIPVLVAVALAAAIAAPQLRGRNLVTLGLGVVVGASPWLAITIARGGRTTEGFTPAEPFLQRTIHSVTVVLPAMLTRIPRRVAFPGDAHGDPHHGVLIGVVVLLGTIAWLVWSVRRRRWPLAVAGTMICLWPLFVAGFGLLAVSEAYRYALPVLAPLAVFGGWMLARLPPLANIPVVVALLAVTLAPPFLADRPPARACSEDHRAVISRLIEQGRTASWSTYWLAAPISVCSNLAITTSSLVTVRDAAAARQVEQASPTTVIVVAEDPLDRAIGALAVGQSGRRIQFGRIAVWELVGHVPRTALPALT